MVTTALITLVCLALLFVVNANFPLHEPGLWSGIYQKVFSRPVVTSAKYIKNPADLLVFTDPKFGIPLNMPIGPLYTPDLTHGKIAIVSDSEPRINNFISNVLKDDPYDIKYLRVGCAGKVVKLIEPRITMAHMIYGWDRLPGVENVIDGLMERNAVIFYGDQLYMNL